MATTSNVLLVGNDDWCDQVEHTVCPQTFEVEQSQCLPEQVESLRDYDAIVVRDSNDFVSQLKENRQILRESGVPIFGRQVGRHPLIQDEHVSRLFEARISSSELVEPAVYESIEKRGPKVRILVVAESRWATTVATKHLAEFNFQKWPLETLNKDLQKHEIAEGFSCILIGWNDGLEENTAWQSFCRSASGSRIFRAFPAYTEVGFESRSYNQWRSSATSMFAFWENRRPDQITRNYLRRVIAGNNMSTQSAHNREPDHFKQFVQSVRKLVTSWINTDRSIDEPINRHFDFLRAMFKHELIDSDPTIHARTVVEKCVFNAVANVWLSRKHSTLPRQRGNELFENRVGEAVASINEEFLLAVLVLLCDAIHNIDELKIFSSRTRDERIELRIQNIPTTESIDRIELLEKTLHATGADSRLFIELERDQDSLRLLLFPESSQGVDR